MKYRVIMEVWFTKVFFDFDNISAAGKFADSLAENYTGCDREKDNVSFRIDIIPEEEDEQEEEV